MKAEDDVLVLGEERVVILIGEPVRMLGAGLKFHQISDVDHSNFKIGQIFADDRNSSQDLKRGRISEARRQHIRLGVLAVARPLPVAKLSRSSRPKAGRDASCRRSAN